MSAAYSRLARGISRAGRNSSVIAPPIASARSGLPCPS
jgi:hypothetical protein